MAAIPNNWQGTPLTFHPNGKSVGMWMTPRDTDEGVCMEAHSYKPIFLTPFFAKIVVNPENTAAKSANKVHI